MFKGTGALAVVTAVVLWALPVASAPGAARPREMTSDRAAPLHVQGNRLVDAAGQPVQLRGM